MNDAEDEQNIQPTNHIISDVDYIVKIHVSTGTTNCEVNQVLNKVDGSSEKLMIPSTSSKTRHFGGLKEACSETAKERDVS